MGLVEFLLKNWFIVVIAFVVLNNIWKSAKARAGNDGNKTAPKQAMPPFGGDGGGTGGWGKTAKQPPITKAKPSAARSEESPKPMIQKVPLLSDIGAKERDVWDDSPLESKPSLSRAERKPSSAAQPSQGRLSTKTVNRDSLAQGVMWAEILGPPRAKKPFRR